MNRDEVLDWLAEKALQQATAADSLPPSTGRTNCETAADALDSAGKLIESLSSKLSRSAEIHEAQSVANNNLHEMVNEERQRRIAAESRLDSALNLLRRWGTERDSECMSELGQLTNDFLQPETYGPIVVEKPLLIGEPK